MQTRSLHNKTDYQAALKMIERLWNAPKGSASAKRLTALVTLVEEYESKHWPIKLKRRNGLTSRAA